MASRLSPDGEYRRSFWHMDFLWGLTGTQKVKSEHFSVAFKGFQPKAETVRIVDKLDFPEDHPFLKHFRFLKSITADGIQPKQCIRVSVHAASDLLYP